MCQSGVGVYLRCGPVTPPQSSQAGDFGLDASGTGVVPTSGASEGILLARSFPGSSTSSWGFVCDDGFALDEARLVCYMLGYGLQNPLVSYRTTLIV